MQFQLVAPVRIRLLEERVLKAEFSSCDTLQERLITLYLLFKVLQLLLRAQHF